MLPTFAKNKLQYKSRYLNLKKNMLDPYKLLDKVMEYGEIQSDKGRMTIKQADLWNYVIKIDSKEKRKNLSEVINELNARGWLTINNETEIKFGPASFL